jgi:hypothetical protein
MQAGAILLFLALLGAVVSVRLSSTEPRYQGRTVSQWFEQCAKSVQSDGTIQDLAAVRAVLQFREKSVPCLAEALKRRKAPFAEDWNKMRSSLPPAASDVLPRQLESGEAWQRTWAAHEIVAAAPPELRMAIAKAAVPALLAEIRNPKVPDRGYRLSFMQVLQPEPGLVISDLNLFLMDADPLVRQASCAFLRHYGRAAAPAMSNLLRVVTNGEPNTIYAREFAIEALGGIGPEAKPAVPVLSTMLKQPNSNLCAAATSALQRINSETNPKETPQ